MKDNFFQKSEFIDPKRLLSRDGMGAPEGFPKSPMDLPPDMFPLSEFKCAWEIAKALGMSAEQSVLEDYLRLRVEQLASKAQEHPVPLRMPEKK